jgi:hypothetical protein
MPVKAMKETAGLVDRFWFVSDDYYACYDESWGPIDHDLVASSEASRAVYLTMLPRVDVEEIAREAAYAVHRSTGSEDRQIDQNEQSAQCELVREVFNPFARFDPAWRTPQAMAIARTVYEDRAFSEMPVLADALEDAGCTQQDVLQHCRDRQKHVRGCWVLDSVLDRT